MAASEGEGAIEPTHPRLAEVRGRVFFSLLFLGTGAHPCLKRFRIFVVEVFLFFFLGARSHPRLLRRRGPRPQAPRHAARGGERGGRVHGHWRRRPRCGPGRGWGCSRQQQHGVGRQQRRQACAGAGGEPWSLGWLLGPPGPGCFRGQGVCGSGCGRGPPGVQLAGVPRGGLGARYPGGGGARGAGERRSCGVRGHLLFQSKYRYGTT